MRRAALAFGFACVAMSFYAPPARACGGCFHEANAPTENTSVITDHRMALAVSTTQTVLWDQVRYQGNPKEFAWVLPVGVGARVELARDEWLQALNVLTAVQVSAPLVSCPPTSGSYGGGGGGCGAGGDNSTSPGVIYDKDGGVTAKSDGGFEGNGSVSIVSQDVVGPYLAVTIRSSSGEAISQWLTDNGFAIPPSIEPVLDHYTQNGFDFIALRLAPDVGVQAMQPVRVVTPGADPTLPLRMVAAGIGSSVGLELYVISEGRYETKNFTALTVDPSTIQWDPFQLRSNYTETFAGLVGSGAWVTEYSGPLGGLSSTYKSACIQQPDIAVEVDCTSDAGDAGADATTDDAQADDAAEAGADDALADDAQTDDADLDAGPSDGSTADADADAGTSGSCVKYVSACSVFDDYDTATTGLAPYDTWVTRLRTSLPPALLDKDLELGASVFQQAISNKIKTTTYTTPYDPCPKPPPPTPTYNDKEGCGCTTAGDHDVMTSTAFASLALYMLVRRRRKARS